METAVNAETTWTGEEQFRLLVQGVTDYAIYMLDLNGNVTSWNPGASRIKGYLPEEIIGQHFSRFYTEEDRLAGEPQRGLDIALKNGRFEKEGWRIRKDGSRFQANVVIDVVRSDGGQIIGFAKITRDITEKIEAQRALDQARQELFQAQKMEAIGQLAGGIAHDFNNLLMAVLGSLEIARRRLPYDSAVTPLIDNAIQGAHRGAALTQRMLAFSRRQDLHVQPLDMPALLRGMGDLLERSLGPATFVKMDLPDHMPLISSDPNQLENAILNLAVNARDAMPNGGTIRISTKEAIIPAGADGPMQPGRYVCLSVSDNGEGMDAETLSRATTPFFTTKGVGKGTGLGLPMVLGLTEQSGGRLVLKSRKGKGTDAQLWFPVVEGTHLAEPEEQPRSAFADDRRQPLTILAVDDDGLVLMNTSLMLEDLGHRVLEASSGGDALAILRHEQVDLVISDHAMPRMTGCELAAAIRAEWSRLPVILATGYAELPPGSDIDLLRLAKPFSQRELADAIARAMV